MYFSIFPLVSQKISPVSRTITRVSSYLTRVWSYRRRLTIDKPYGGPSVLFEGAKAKSS